jgi:hypothetical protein
MKVVELDIKKIKNSADISYFSRGFVLISFGIGLEH